MHLKQNQGLSENDKLSTIYTVTLSVAQLYIVDKLYFPTTPGLFCAFPYLPR